MGTVAVAAVTEAAAALVRAGRWAQATELLDAVTPDDPRERGALAVAAADVAVDQDFFRHTALAPAALARAQAPVEAADDETIAWDLRFQRLRQAYFAALLGPDGTPRFSNGDGDRDRDEASLAALYGHAEQVAKEAPDRRRAGTVAFYAGLIAENLRGARDTGAAHYAEALAAARQTGDDHLAALALRHLGAQSYDAGDTRTARARWEESTALRARAGHVTGLFAQHVLLATLDRDRGEPARAAGLAAEVARWARETGAGALERQARELLT